MTKNTMRSDAEAALGVAAHHMNTLADHWLTIGVMLNTASAATNQPMSDSLLHQYFAINKQLDALTADMEVAYRWAAGADR
jgi:hypothetical protein